MSTPLDPNRSLEDLLEDLKQAVAAGDQDRAAEIERAIMKRLLADTMERDDIER